tara:strand:+ start:10443 stop:12296 length:1854 start_codon:yes stop_codon:yes gene_type:complete
MPKILNWLLRLAPTNPICIRIVAGGGRRWRDMVIRALYLSFMIALTLSVLLGNLGSGYFSMRGLASSGASIFQATAYVQIILICLLTPLFMAGAIVQESNPRTWDILLSTPLNSAQIVLGNILGRLFFIVALLLASLPLFIFLQMFGGVPGHTIIDSYVIAICSALLVASIAVTLSVTRIIGKKAVFVFYAAIVLYLVGTFVLDSILRTPINTTAGIAANSTTWLTPLNPFLAIEALLQPSTYQTVEVWGRGWLHTQWMMHPVQTFNWLCCLISVILVVYATLRVRLLIFPNINIDWLLKVFKLSPDGAVTRMPRPVGQNPIAWRESHLRRNLGSICSRWGFLIVGLLLLVGVLINYAMSDGLQDSIRFTRLMLTGLLMAEVIIVVLTAVNLSATAVSGEREDGFLDLILTTPIQPGAYLAGKNLGLVKYLMPMIALPVVSMLLISLFMYAGGVGPPVVFERLMANGMLVQEPLVIPSLGIAFMLVFVPFIAFCVMVGLHWSIRSRGNIGSVVASVLLLSSLFLMLGLCVMPAGVNLPMLGVLLTNLNPANMLITLEDPVSWLAKSWQSDPEGGTIQFMMIIGGLISGGIYLGLAWAMHKSMTRTFMMTVRRLSGTQ